MWSLTRLRKHPFFANDFAYVHPSFWPVLWWQLYMLIRWLKANSIGDVLYSLKRWGIVRVRYAAPRVDPALYKPLPRTFRLLSDPGWGCAVPACLEMASPEAASGRKGSSQPLRPPALK